jgi:hypothetical protein
MSALCPLVHDHDAEVERTLAVCRSHHRQASLALSELPGLHASLTHRLITSGTGLTGMPHGSTDPGISLDHRVVQVRSDIRNVLTTWARHVVDERQVRPPVDMLANIALFVGSHLSWLLEQDYGPAFALDVIGPWETARMLMQPNPSRAFAVGGCPDCDGTLIAVLRPQDSLLPHEVVCDASPFDEDGTPLHHWTADRWLTLGRKIRRPHP